MNKFFRLFRTKSNKIFDECLNKEVSFLDWTNFKNKDFYLSGYFDFPLYDIKKDSSHKRIRSFILLSYVESILKNCSCENVAECGCYLGHSSFAISTILKKFNFNKKFYIFDSFEGLSNIDNEDISLPNAKDTMNLVKQHNLGNLRFKGSITQYKELMKKFDFIEILDGWIPNRFNDIWEEKFSIVNIDVDLYQPTLDSLNFFYSRLISGGIIYIDDYSRPYWPGADKAVCEFLNTINPTEYYLIKIPLGGAIIHKL